MEIWVAEVLGIASLVYSRHIGEKVDHRQGLSVKPLTILRLDFGWWVALYEAFQVAQWYMPANAGDAKDGSLIPGLGGSPGEEVATHSSILAWRIPWTEEPGGLQSLGSQRVGHDWVTSTFTFAPLQLTHRSPNPQCNDIRRWGLWEETGFRWGPGCEDLKIGLVSL